MKRQLESGLLLAALVLLANGAAFSTWDTALGQPLQGHLPGQGAGPECTAVNDRLNFPAYWAGSRFDGLDLTAVIRNCGGPHVNSVDYIYGTCDASRGGCSEPIEIQSWPPELRNKSMYNRGPDLFAVKGTDTFVEGVPAFRVGGSQLEIYYPDVTVVIHGGSRERVDRFATALVRGPKDLLQVERYGIIFDEGCIDENYCEGDRPGDEPSFAETIVMAALLFLIGPLIAILFRPPASRNRTATSD